jgi:hypothetical protein
VLPLRTLTVPVAPDATTRPLAPTAIEMLLGETLSSACAAAIPTSASTIASRPDRISRISRTSVEQPPGRPLVRMCKYIVFSLSIVEAAIPRSRILLNKKIRNV